MSASSDISDFLRHMDQEQKTTIDAAAQALAEVVEDINTDAKDHCPLDKGDLLNSHYVKPVEVTANSITCEHGANAAHAAVVHENLEQPLRTEKNPKAEHKWIENAINRKREAGLEHIAAKIRAARSQ